MKIVKNDTYVSDGRIYIYPFIGENDSTSFQPFIVVNDNGVSIAFTTSGMSLSEVDTVIAALQKASELFVNDFGATS